MNVTQVDTLRVAGASLYYEVRGSGPVLLMIGAGAADAASFNGITTHLADQYTVVRYDRRGYSRSPLDDPEEEQRIETHSDDAHRLLDHRFPLLDLGYQFRRVHPLSDIHILTCRLPTFMQDEPV